MPKQSREVLPSPFTSPPVPLSSRRGGICIAGGHPKTPARGKSLRTPFTSVTAKHVVLRQYEWWCDADGTAPRQLVVLNDNRTLIALTWKVSPSPFTSPPIPLSSRRGGICIAGGHPQTPARGKSLWTPFTSVIARSEASSYEKWTDAALLPQAIWEMFK